jgi:MFS family permease
MLKRFGALRYIKNRSLRALLIADAIVLIATAMLTPIYATFVEEVGGDVLDAGITAAALAFGAGFASLVAGKYPDALKDKKIMIVYGFAAIGVFFLLYTQVTTVWHLALVQLLMGLVRALFDPAFDALFSTHLDKNKEAEEWGAWEGMAYFSAGIGAILGAGVVALFNFDALFIVMGALCFASSLYVFRLPRRVL